MANKYAIIIANRLVGKHDCEILKRCGNEEKKSSKTSHDHIRQHCYPLNDCVEFYNSINFTLKLSTIKIFTKKRGKVIMLSIWVVGWIFQQQKVSEMSLFVKKGGEKRFNKRPEMLSFCTNKGEFGEVVVWQ